MKRLFLAIPINTTDNGFEPLIDNLKGHLGHEKAINWTEPRNVHLTLKFLGSVFPQDEPKIIEAVGEVLEKQHSFTMDFNKTGIFGSHHDPRVIWLGMQEIPEKLFGLENELLDAFDKIGFMRDRQNFVPHLTLARIKYLCEKQYFQKFVQTIEQKSYVKQEVNEIVLFQSFLRPDGAMYKRLKTWKLK